MAGMSRADAKRNYEKLIAAMRVSVMTTRDMEGVLNCSHGAANHYRRAMERFGILIAVQETDYAQSRSAVYGITTDEQAIDLFMAFIESCRTRDDELVAPDLDIMDAPRRFMTAARSMGITRPDYISCLFGEKGMATA